MIFNDPTRVFGDVASCIAWECLFYFMLNPDLGQLIVDWASCNYKTAKFKLLLETFSGVDGEPTSFMFNYDIKNNGSYL